MFLRKRSRKGVSVAAFLVIAALVVLGMIWFANVTEENAANEGLRITQDSISRAAVQCYALEGRYPPSLDYLMEHYGLSPNEELYTIYYQFVAANLMPDITVLHKSGALSIS